MRRRVVVSGAVAIATAALPARAQSSRKRIAIFSWWSETDAGMVRLLVDELARLGYIDGRSIDIEYYWAAQDLARAESIAADLVRRQVDLIVARATPAIVVAKRATAIIPIVMAPSANPLATGLVASLARPGGNVTGLSAVSTDLGGKRLQIAREILPDLRRVAFLGSTVDPNGQNFADEIEAAGRAQGLEVLSLLISGQAEIAGAFARAAGWGAGAMFIQPLFSEYDELLLRLSMQHRIPMVGTRRDMAAGGALLAYGTNPEDQLRRAAHYVDRILRGAKPSDLPVEEPTNFELVINRRVATALGIMGTQSILVRAVEVIE